MPRDGQGVYSLPAGYQATPGNPIRSAQHNQPLEDLGQEMTGSLPRDGSAPMSAPLLLPDGSGAAPAIASANNPSAGFYFIGSNIFVAGTLIGARYVGELIPWSRVNAPPLCVLPYGQTLLRAQYPDLWNVAQVEMSLGSAFFNNGNGATTFGIADLRGRTLAASDSMGGVAANRLTSATMSPQGSTLGATGGAETHALTTPELASHTHTNTLTDPGHSHGLTNANGASVLTSAGGSEGFSSGSSAHNAAASGITVNSASTGISITNASAGSGAAHINVQPTLICNFALYAGA